MVLAVVDDLLFSSKIRAVAERIGAPVRFVRTREAVPGEVLAAKPRLVIFDLDRAPLDPIGAIGALKADPATRGVRLIGFVSHVHADLIAAARAAGVDAVLARSAFVAALPELLAGTAPAPTEP
jgi:CheY-like chemotaxis protein